MSGLDEAEMLPALGSRGDAPYLTHEGAVEVLGAEGLSMRVIQLSDGNRYIQEDDFRRVLAWLDGRLEPTQPKQTPEKKEEAAVKRCQKFREQALAIHKAEKILSDNEAKRWYDYWTERSAGRYKHRWEYETTFDIRKRMQTWASRVRYEEPKPANSDSKYWNPRQ